LDVIYIHGSFERAFFTEIYGSLLWCLVDGILYAHISVFHFSTFQKIWFARFLADHMALLNIYRALVLVSVQRHVICTCISLSTFPLYKKSFGLTFFLHEDHFLEFFELVSFFHILAFLFQVSSLAYILT